MKVDRRTRNVLRAGVSIVPVLAGAIPSLHVAVRTHLCTAALERSVLSDSFEVVWVVDERVVKGREERIARGNRPTFCRGNGRRSSENPLKDNTAAPCWALLPLIGMPRVTRSARCERREVPIDRTQRLSRVDEVFVSSECALKRLRLDHTQRSR